MLIIFDKDKTLVGSTSGPTPNKLEEQYFLPKVLEKCAALREEGHTLAVASNQGGVAFGFITYQQADRLVGTVAETIGAAAYRFSPFHVKGKLKKYVKDSAMRKPNPGMLLAIMEELGFSKEETMYVGDRPEDQEAARRAEIGFAWAKDFFEWDRDYSAK